MDYFIADTQSRIEIAEKQLKTATTKREKMILRERIRDLNTLKEVLCDIKERTKKDEIVLKR